MYTNANANSLLSLKKYELKKESHKQIYFSRYSFGFPACANQ